MSGHSHHRHDHGREPHGHAHGHRHGHGHSHAPSHFGLAFGVGAALNLAFVAGEVGFGLATRSVALLADAGHNFGDVMALLAAWGASLLARRRPTERFTYGLRSSSLMAALFNAVSLLVITGGVAWEAIRRLFDPPPVAGATVMAVAAVGIAVNGVTAWMLSGGRKGDLNVRGAYMHMLADALVSAGVVAAGGLILLTGWGWIDPAASLVVSGIIAWGTWGLLKESVALVLQAAPSGIAPAQVRALLEAQPGVAGLHDLHIWPMSTTETALTAHLVMPAGHPGDAALAEIVHRLSHRFGIGHATLQVETEGACACPLEPAA